MGNADGSTFKIKRKSPEIFNDLRAYKIIEILYFKSCSASGLLEFSIQKRK